MSIINHKIDENNLLRYLDKWEQTMGYCSTYFETQSESHAAQHLSDRVMYSPICNRLAEMKTDIAMVRNLLKEGQ